MNPNCTTIPVARPLHQRVLDALADGWHAWLDGHRRRAELRRAELEMRAVRDMNEALLRDIGAPEWMVADATQRRIDQLRGLK